MCNNLRGYSVDDSLFEIYLVDGGRLAWKKRYEVLKTAFKGAFGYRDMYCTIRYVSPCRLCYQSLGDDDLQHAS